MRLRPGFLYGNVISKPKHSSFGNLDQDYPPIDIQKLTKTCYPQNITPARKLVGQIDSALSTASSLIGYTPEIKALRNKLYTHLEQHSHGGCGCTNSSDRTMCEGILSSANAAVEKAKQAEKEAREEKEAKEAKAKEAKAATQSSAGTSGGSGGGGSGGGGGGRAPSASPSQDTAYDDSKYEAQRQLFQQQGPAAQAPMGLPIGLPKIAILGAVLLGGIILIKLVK